MGYYDIENTNLKYAAFNGSGWEISTLDSTGDVGYYTSIDTDSSGNVYISYRDSTNQDLKVAYYNGTGWSLQVIDSGIYGNVSGFTSMMLDSNGRPYISYITNDGNYNLNLAYFNGSGWEITVLVADIYSSYGGYPRETALSLYNDYVYISYTAANGDLAVITNAPSGFVDEPSLNILGIIILILLICLWFGNQRLPLGRRS